MIAKTMSRVRVYSRVVKEAEWSGEAQGKGTKVIEIHNCGGWGVAQETLASASVSSQGHMKMSSEVKLHSP